MLVQNVEKALKEMKYFWGELLFENSEWEVGIKRLTDFSFVLDLFTHEDKEIPDEEVGSELYLIIGDIVNEQEYVGENISKLKSEIMLVKKLKLYLNAIWAYDTDRRINNYDECERILAN